MLQEGEGATERDVLQYDVLTITPNPSLDLLHETDEVAWDDANRVASPRRRVGGQGINVARAVTALGGSAFVVAPVGGRTGAEIVGALVRDGIPHRLTNAPGESRIFAALRENRSGRNLLINPRGPSFDGDAVEELRIAAIECIQTHRPRWVACCGSLPPGFPARFYADIKVAARAAGCRFVVDCDGESLRAAADGGCDLLVPNAFEAERLTGLKVTDTVSAHAAAKILIAGGTPVVIITLGSEGAFVASRAVTGSARAQENCDGIAVGAGDSLLAAVLLELNATNDTRKAVCDGVAAGTAVLSGKGSDLIDLKSYKSLAERVKFKEWPAV